MSEEEDKKVAEEKIAAEKAEKEKKDAEDANKFPAMKRAEDLMQKMDEKEKLLLEKEEKLNEQMDSFDKKVAETKLSGFGSARIEKSDEEKAIDEASKIFADTGLNPFDEPYDPISKNKKTD